VESLGKRRKEEKERESEREERRETGTEREIARLNTYSNSANVPENETMRKKVDVAFP